ncbi:Sec-independent protein translocase protein TatB [Echinimonas agarilytica]|uniref:Sec-independent protein translocase protein TatB n=1 Tax=Echinimonas agarilytica TaxID=1215918 RepID=A0AA41W461_9GAMM|nr:Sec-independent protein translocase protein TatB [Echinimonas agarilytica]
MFDIGFWELAVIAVLGLLVLGPERLPTALRNVMNWVRSVKTMANNVKQDISQELHLHELQQDLKKAEQQGMKDLSPELQSSIDELKDAAESVQRPYQTDSSGEENQILDSQKKTPKAPTSEKNND